MMRKGAKSAFSRRGARGARRLSCLLLLLITYGATVGVIHRHRPPGSLTVTAETSSKSFVRGQTGPPSSSLPFNPGDCSICQFHRQLNGGLLYTPAFEPAPESHHAPARVALVSYLSATGTPRRGRAPPQLSTV